MEDAERAFTLETFERRGVFGEVRSEKFQRDLAAETGVFRPEKLYHPSAAQWVNYVKREIVSPIIRW